MKPRVGKVSILLGLVGFMVIGFLLFAGHPGFASSIAVYNYLLILIGVLYGLCVYEK